MSQQNSNIQQDLLKKVGGNFEYKMIILNLFSNLHYEISANKSNNIISQNISNEGQTFVEQLLIDNKLLSKSFGFELGKYIPKMKSKISIGYDFNNRLNDILINNNLKSVKSIQNGLNLKFNSNYFTWLTLDYNFNYFNSKREAINVNKFISNLKVLFYFFENHSFGIYKDDYVYSFDKQNFKNQFIDLSYQYTFKKSKIDLDFKWSNVLNIKSYEEVILNDYSTTSNVFTIRPSQILMSVKFNFK